MFTKRFLQSNQLIFRNLNNGILITNVNICLLVFEFVLQLKFSVKGDLFLKTMSSNTKRRELIMDNYLHNPNTSCAEIGQLAGVSRATVRIVLKIRKDKTVTQSPRMWSYSWFFKTQLLQRTLLQPSDVSRTYLCMM